TKDDLRAQFEEELRKVGKELSRVGRDQPDEGEVVMSQVRPLRQLLSEIISDCTSQASSSMELLRDIGLVVKKKLTAFNGDSICEMDIDYWGPTLQELPMFQGFEEVKKVVEARLQMWADPIKEGLSDFYELLIRQVVKEDVLGSKLGLSAEVTRSVAARWEELAKECTATLKTKLVPPDDRYFFDSDGKRDDSLLEKLWKNPPAESVYVPMDERDINEQLNPTQPQEVLNRFADPEQLDISVESYEKSDMKDVPNVAKVTLIVRDRIKIASRHWVGYYDSRRNKVSGAMGKFLDAFTKDLLEAIEKFQDFADHNLYKKWCTGALSKDPYAEEREKLLEREKLIREALHEIEALSSAK
ncbi:MAG: hypothetical protein SGPRY_010140, partial [Prymnesium sp.]